MLASYLGENPSLMLCSGQDGQKVDSVYLDSVFNGTFLPLKKLRPGEQK